MQRSSATSNTLVVQLLDSNGRAQLPCERPFTLNGTARKTERIMSIITSYILSSLNDGVIPHLREPVESVFDDVVRNKGLPTRSDFRELRNRVDMLDFKTRELTRLLNEVRGELKRSQEPESDKTP